MTSAIGRQVARAAVLITVLTIAARLAGFGRNLVFSRTVGQTCLADTYQTVNMVPNILFEVVAGGALASLVVPLLSRAVAAGDRERAGRTASALLTWTVVVLTPLAILVALLAEPIAAGLLGAKSCAGAVEVGASMLRVFAPQIVLYGVGIVLTGVLQAHRRFGGPALAPLLSSLVVIGSYLLYASQARRGTDVDTLSTSEELILSVGTTLGVVVMAGSLLVPLSRTGLRLRPRLRLPDGVARRARSLAAAGIATLAAQQIAVAVTLVLGNAEGVPDGTVAVFTYAHTMYLLPWAVLAVPVATSVFPRLSERADAGDTAAYQRELAGATRAVLLLSLVAAAALAAAAPQLARILVQSAPGRPSVEPLTEGIAAMAPGLIGYSLFALLSRALYAADQARRAAYAGVLGWAVVIAADFVLAAGLPPEDRVLALAAGNSIGMTVLGGALLVAVARRGGTAALAGVGRSAAGGVTAAVVAGGLGYWLASALSGGGAGAAVGQAVGVGAVVLVGFAGMMMLVARATVLEAVRALRGARSEGESE